MHLSKRSGQPMVSTGSEYWTTAKGRCVASWGSTLGNTHPPRPQSVTFSLWILGMVVIGTLVDTPFLRVNACDKGGGTVCIVAHAPVHSSGLQKRWHSLYCGPLASALKWLTEAFLVKMPIPTF